MVPRITIHEKPEIRCLVKWELREIINGLIRGRLKEKTRFYALFRPNPLFRRNRITTREGARSRINSADHVERTLAFPRTASAGVKSFRMDRVVRKKFPLPDIIALSGPHFRFIRRTCSFPPLPLLPLIRRDAGIIARDKIYGSYKTGVKYILSPLSLVTARAWHERVFPRVRTDLERTLIADEWVILWKYASDIIKMAGFIDHRLPNVRYADISSIYLLYLSVIVQLLRAVCSRSTRVRSVKRYRHDFSTAVTFNDISQQVFGIR